MSDDFTFYVRRADKKDIPKLIEMKGKLQQHMERNNKNLWGMSKEFIKNLNPYYEQQIDNPDACLLVACEEGSDEIIGMSLGKIKHHDGLLTGISGRIDDVWVEPSSRRHGICEDMFSYLIDFFKNNHVSHLVLEYAIYNKEAEITWTRLGFRPSLIISTADIDDVKEAHKDKVESVG